MSHVRRDSFPAFFASAFLLLFLILPVFSGPPSLAEEPQGWYPQNSGTTVHLMAVGAADERTAWVTGYGGTILKTTDGGTTWVAQNSGVTSELRSLSVVNSSTAWAAGDFLLRTTDGGATWSKLNLGKNFYAYHVCAVSASVVWVAGNYWVATTGDYQRQVRRSTNSGASWTTYVLPTTEPINDLCAVDAKTAWVACTNGVILKTTNGGSSWDKLSTETGDTFTDMDVLNADTVFAVSANRVYRTWDGGIVWNFSEVGLGYLRAVEAVNPSTIWAVGDDGLIVKSTDGGGTWTRQRPQDTDFRSYYGISAVNTEVGWIAGSDGKIFHTVNGGVEPPPVPEITALTPDHVYPLTLAWVNGDNFGTLASPESYGTECYLSLGSSMVPISNILKWESQSVFFRVPAGLPPGPVEVSVTVKGITSKPATLTVVEPPPAGWRLQDPGTNMPLSSVSAADAHTAWAVGLGGTILRTTDGGNTWKPQDSGTTRNLLVVSAASTRVAWAGGEEVLLLTVDGGESWRTVSAEPGYCVYDIAAVDEQNCWVVGGGMPYGSLDRGFILRTRNGGGSWALQVANHHCNMYSIAAVDAATAWVAGGESLLAGSAGVVLRTTDGGSTWTPSGPADRNWCLIAACDASTAMVWGTSWQEGSFPPAINPECRKTADGGATWTALGADQIAPVHTPFSGAEMFDTQNIWLATSPGPPPYTGIARTTNGGASWSYQLDDFLSYPNTSMTDISTVDRDTAWAVGGYTILHTTDGGYKGPAPVIDSVSPSSGGSFELVTIGGRNFGSQGRSSVVFSDRRASVESWTDTSIVCRAPEIGASNLRVPVTVTTPNGTSNPAYFSYGTGFAVQSIVPAQCPQFTFLLNATVAGTGFLPGATVRLEKGAVVITAASATVTSAERIDCVLPLWGAEPGTYDVVVKNPDGSEARLAGGFTVTSACGQGGGTAALLAGASMGLLSLAGTTLRRRRRRR